jgi:2-amino-4-hydroxy-6-hydroxymethyldihydropteridine diphosphokinase
MSAVKIEENAIIVALGSNLTGAYASLEELLDAALDQFEAAGLHIVARSTWWKSAAWPDPTGPEYRNGVVIVETALDPHETLDALRQIERAFGRERGKANNARTLDLDLIAYGRAEIDVPSLTVPHPRAHQRRFVMGPLAEIAPGWRHPSQGGTAESLAKSAAVGRDAAPAALHNQ